MKPITKEKIGWGFVATGRIAKDFAECIALLDDCYVAAVGSRTVESAKRFTDVYGGKPYGSYEEMMQDPDVDVVYIATPHMVHEENVAMAAKYGKHILCEKPFAVNRPQAERMFAAARRPACSSWRACGRGSSRRGSTRARWSPPASWESSSPLTPRPAGARGPEGFPGRPPHRPESGRRRAARRRIYVLAATSVAVGGLTKMPKQVFSTMRFEDSGVDSDTDMLLELDGGVTAHLVCSLHRRNHEATIYCENGKIYIPNHRNPSSVTVTKRISQHRTGAHGHLFDGTDVHTVERPYQKYGFQFEAAAVHDCLRKGLLTCPQVPPEETLTLIGICDQIRKEHGFKYPFED